ncbi:MobV family relaxase, partial [Avibacterium avium]
MGFAILRTQKLKSIYAINRSLKHAFRLQDTPNADKQRTPENISYFSDSKQSALERLNSILPEKRRKNAVLAVEYLITASPEDMHGKTQEQQMAYFNDSIEWLKAKHGEQNIVNIGIHFDETTPHLYAYVVPIDQRGKLNCRAFFGGAKALSDMQSDFAERVGKKHGLERGIKGSKAKHQRVSKFYANINNHEQIAEYEKNRQMAWKLAKIDIKPRILRYEEKWAGLKKIPIYETDLHIEERLYRDIVQPVADRNYQLQLEKRKIQGYFDGYAQNHRLYTSGLKKSQIDALQSEIDGFLAINERERAEKERLEREQKALKMAQKRSMGRGGM